MTYIGQFLPILFFTMLNCLFCAFSGQSFGKMLPLTFMGAVFLECLSQVCFRSFQPGFLLLLALSVAGFVALLYRSLRKGDAKPLNMNGLYAFLAICAVYFFIDFGRFLSEWDEMMHWGKMVKELLRLDRFYCVEEAALYTHREYPPFAPVLEMLWCKLAGGYSVMGASMALHIFQMTLLVPFLADDRDIQSRRGALGKLFIWVMLVFGAVTFVLFTDDPVLEVFHSICLDITISILFAYALFLVYTRKVYTDRWSYMGFCLCLMTLIFSKQIGPAFAGIALLYYWSVHLYDNRGSRKPVRAILTCAVPAIACAAVYLGWKMVTRHYGLSGQFDLSKKVSLQQFFAYIRERGFEYQTVLRIYKALFNKNIFSGVIPITFASSMLIILILLEVIHRFSKGGFSRGDRNITGIVLCLGAAGYTLVMLVIYIFCMEKSEMEKLHSLPRYMSSFSRGGFLLLLLIVVDQLKKKGKWILNARRVGVVVLLEMALLCPTMLVRETPQIFLGNKNGRYAAMARTISDSTEPLSKIYMTQPEKRGRNVIFTLYFVDDVYISRTWKDLLNTDYEDNPEEKAAVLDVLKEHDYMYTVETSQLLDKNFSEYNGGEPFEGDSVYEIIKEGDSIRFKNVTVRR